MPDFSVGARMWLPCQVKPGPFSDERMVLVEGDRGEWFGFVNVRWLQSGEDEGADQVLAHVVEVDGSTFKARIPGNAPHKGLFEGQVAHVASS